MIFVFSSIVLIKLCVNVPSFNSLNNLICVFSPFFCQNKYQLQGSVDDCSCTIDTVDYFNNNKMHPRLKSLLVRDYFRFYKVNLRKECPFWADDGRCAMRSCHVSPCSESDVPAGLKGQYQQESFLFKVSKKIMKFLYEHHWLVFFIFIPIKYLFRLIFGKKSIYICHIFILVFFYCFYACVICDSKID